MRILEQKLDRAIATNNTSSQVIMRATVVSYRPGEAEVFILSGLTIGLALALVSAGPARPSPMKRKSLRATSVRQRRVRRFVKFA